MREIRPSGSEGGGAGSLPLSLPLWGELGRAFLAAELFHLPDKPAGVLALAKSAASGWCADARAVISYGVTRHSRTVSESGAKR